MKKVKEIIANIIEAFDACGRVEDNLDGYFIMQSVFQNVGML